MRCYSEPVVVNHGVIYWTSGCESWFVMLSQWLWTMVWYTAPVVVKRGDLCWTSGCESWCVMLSKWIVNQGVVCWATGCESWFVMLSQWFRSMVSYAVPGGLIMVCNAEPVVVNHALLYWFVWLWIMVNNDKPVVLNHGVLYWGSGCES